MRSAHLHVLTGAPGSGKTTILDNVGTAIRCVSEPAREVLADQRSANGPGTPDRDPSLFVDLLLRRSIDKHQAAERMEGATLFDRGVPDCIAYATLMGVDPAPSILAAKEYRYHENVFVLEPWEEIYTPDGERTMSFAATLPFQRALVDAYERAAYHLIEVPQGPIDDRAAFVRDRIVRR